MPEDVVERVVGRLKEMGLTEAELNEDLIKKIKLLLKEFKVPEEEVVRTVVNSIRKERILKAPVTKIADLRKGAIADLSVKVLAVFEGRGKVVQRAIAGDPTGKAVIANLTKFNLEAKKCYRIKNALVDYDERRKIPTVLVTGLTEVTEIQEDIQVAKDQFEGMVIDVPQAGFVLLCPVCRKPLKMGACSEHGKQNQPVERVQAKFIVDNGKEAVYARIADEKLEEALGISRNTLKELLIQSFDMNAPKQLIEGRLLGKHVTLEGFRGRATFFADRLHIMTSAELEEKTKQILAELLAGEKESRGKESGESRESEESIEDIEVVEFDLNDILGR